jgi:hypothetical protein
MTKLIVAGLRERLKTTQNSTKINSLSCFATRREKNCPLRDSNDGLWKMNHTNGRTILATASTKGKYCPETSYFFGTQVTSTSL